MTLYDYHSLVLADNLINLFWCPYYTPCNISDEARFTHARAASFLAPPNQDLSLEDQRIALYIQHVKLAKLLFSRTPRGE